MEFQFKAARVSVRMPGLVGLQDFNAFRIALASKKVVWSWPSLRLRLLRLLCMLLSLVTLTNRSHASQMGLFESQLSTAKPTIQSDLGFA